MDGGGGGKRTRSEWMSRRSPNSPLISESCTFPDSPFLLTKLCALQRVELPEPALGHAMLVTSHTQCSETRKALRLHTSGKLACGQLSLLDPKEISRHHLSLETARKDQGTPRPVAPHHRTHTISRCTHVTFCTHASILPGPPRLSSSSIRREPGSRPTPAPSYHPATQQPRCPWLRVMAFGGCPVGTLKDEIKLQL